MKHARVKVSVEHLRDDITKYLQAEAVVEGELIATKIGEAVAAFDFDAKVAAICEAELEKFVRDAANAYFRTLLHSPEARAAVVEALNTQLEGHT